MKPFASPRSLTSSLVDAWTADIAQAVWDVREAAWADAEAVISKARAMLWGQDTLDVGSLLREYIQGAGSCADPTHAGLRRLITNVGKKFDLLQEGEDFFEKNWSVKRRYLEMYCSDLLEDVFDESSNDRLERTQALEPCPNEIVDLRLPAHLGHLSRLWRRPALWVYSTEDALAYVHPYQYQIISRDLGALWASASPRHLLKSRLLPARRVETDGRVVVVQDRFDFRNFAHFLCDGITRLLHFVTQFGIRKDDLFVFGSIPADYHRLIFATLRDLSGIQPRNLLFPSEGLLLDSRRKCYWFSDQKDVYAHPAQVAHPTSVTLLRTLSSRICGAPSKIKRLYISRADAKRRRVTNETELYAALHERGFERVVLGPLPVGDQIGLFQNAEIIVAPHGMGLTHLVMGRRLGQVIELFHPASGTEAYALLTRALGISYDFVVGEQSATSPEDFSVPVDLVLQLVDRDTAARYRPCETKAANLIAGSKSFRGFVLPHPDASEAVPERMSWDQHAQRHLKSDPVPFPELGRWQGIPVSSPNRYTVSCWVRIDADFAGSQVNLEIGNWPDQARHGAELSCRSVWQRIWTTARAPESATSCWTGLRVDAPAGTVVHSTCWQFERGSTPGAYVATL